LLLKPVVLLEGGGIFRRWGLVAGSEVTGGRILKGIVKGQHLPVFLCFLAVMSHRPRERSPLATD
jgi:hypothetical protein